MTIKLSELRRVVLDYRTSFPGWQVSGGMSLVRLDGPILQGILFNRASSDIYRPTGYLRVLTAPEPAGVYEFPQELRNPNGSPGRSVPIASHQKYRDVIVQELRRQIRPSVDQPLDVGEVLALLEGEAVPNAPEAYSLATLHAYLAHERQARAWCARFAELQAQFTDWSGIDVDRAAFIKRLEQWLDAGKAREHLEDVIRAERHKLGVA